MDVLLVPVNCRLSRVSLDNIAVYANCGVKDVSVRFDLMPRHRTRHHIARGDLMDYVASQFPPFTIAVVSREILRSSDGMETMGLGDSEVRIGLVRAESGYRAGLRDENVAQTIVHELMHMIGEEHHTHRRHSANGLLCPFMSYSLTRETSIVPCVPCKSGLRSFAEHYRAA